ncbi:MAG: VWA domain-containing protein [Luteitalea sp.]|nr:VWA domain-containing protein [Luteitalea sp.]
MRELLLGVLVAAVAAPVSAQEVFRTTADPLVRVGVAVIDDNGALVSGLTPEDFVVLEDGRRQTVRLFAHGDDLPDELPLHVGLLLDTSGSMEDDIRFARTAAIKFLRLVPAPDDMTVVDFATEVRLARFQSSQFPRLVERIRGQPPEGWTALYDALSVYLHGAFDQDGDKVLALYTDGGDTSSTSSFTELLDLVRTSDVTIYAIGLLEHQPPSVRLEQRLRLQQITDESGGEAFFPMSVKELDAAYARVLDEIKGRYILGYISTNERQDGTWRKLHVRLTRDDVKDVKLRTRKGYFALYRAEK